MAASCHRALQGSAIRLHCRFVATLLTLRPSNPLRGLQKNIPNANRLASWLLVIVIKEASNMRLYAFPAVFYIFIAGLIAYIAVLLVYLKKISRAKKEALDNGKTIPKAQSSYKAIFPASIALIILPLLIPLGNLITAVVCACAVLGLYISLKDRLSSLGPTGSF